MTTSMTVRHTGLALLVIVLWGVNFVVIHEGLVDVPPLVFAALRFAVVACCALVVPRPQVPLRDLAAVGLLQSAGQFGMLYSALATGMASGLASLVLQVQALFTVLIAAVVLRERPRGVQVAGMAVAFTGLAVVALGSGGRASWLGFVLCVAAGAFWGAGNVAARRCSGASGLGITVWGSVFVPVPLVLLALVVEGPHVVAHGLDHFGWHGLLSTAYTVAVATLVCYSAWNLLMGRYPAASVAPFTLLIPVVGLVTGWIVLGERPTVLMLLGGLVLLVGVAIVVVGPRLLAARQRRTA